MCSNDFSKSISSLYLVWYVNDSKLLLLLSSAIRNCTRYNAISWLKWFSQINCFKPKLNLAWFTSGARLSSSASTHRGAEGKRPEMTLVPLESRLAYLLLGEWVNVDAEEEYIFSARVVDCTFLTLYGG